MKCDVMLLEDYVEDFLNEQQKRAVEQHMKQCASCKQQYMQLKQEQQLLMEQLNKPMLIESQAGDIMGQLNIKKLRKNRWQTIQVAMISVAVLVVSFALYSLNQTNDRAEPPNPPVEVIAENDAPEPSVTEQEPMLQASIDQVVEDGEETEIHFRLKLNESLQQQQNALYEEMRTRYHYKAMDDSQLPSIPEAFWGHVRTAIKLAIRDEQGNLIVATKYIEGETPMLNSWGMSGDITDVLGERIFTMLVPTYTKPATLEVLHMQAELLALYEAKMDNTTRQPFEFNERTYELDALELTNAGLQMTLSTAGKLERFPIWNLVINNEFHSFTEQNVEYRNGRTVMVSVFSDIKTIPEQFKLVPTTALIEQSVEEPIVLQLRQ